MKRREFITGLGTAASWPFGTRAQQLDRVREVGVLFGGFSATDSEPRARMGALTRQLRELGWIEGRNLKIELRFGRGDDNLRRAYAEELVGLKPDVIVANSAPAIVAVAKQTATIPIVFTNFFDPIGSGLIGSLAHPEANITGFSDFEPNITGKWLELLKAIAPGVTRVSAMFDRNDSYVEFSRTAEQLASEFHLQYAAAPVSEAAEIQQTIEAIARQPNGSLMVMGGTVASANRQRLVEAVFQHGIPAVYAFRYYVTNGGLISYGVDSVDIFRRAAAYVDRVLKGLR
jgi:putative tryptophan/tyrosine transport system substrate-binding protein